MANSPSTPSMRFIYGFHAVASKLRTDPESILEIFVASQRTDIRAKNLISRAELADVRIVLVDAARLDGMTGTRRNQGVVARIDGRRKEVQLDDILDNLSAEDPALFLVLDGIKDPHNLGACLRVADAAGVHAVIAPKDRAVGLNATAIKVASGAADTVAYITVTNLARALRELKDAGVWCVGATDDAEKSVYAIDQRGSMAWVLGAEEDGLRRLTRETCDDLAQIPMLGSVESLNVSVASGICLFEARRQRSLAPA